MGFSHWSFRLAAIVGLALGADGLAAPVHAEGRARIGLLECNVSPGVGFVITSSRALSCRFTPVEGDVQFYVGTIRKYGLALGISGPSKLVWAVLAASAPQVSDALAGDYIGATGSASIGAGLGANALIGGSHRSIALQPVSVSAETGVNLAAGVGELILEPAPQH